jgi:polyhydroxyalkanoate synthesis regulator phasin
MAEERKSARAKVSDGIRQGIGVLSAFKDALEETINEARERGDLSTDRAKEVMKGALHRAHEAAEGARERLDFVNQKDFDGLRAVVDEVRERVTALEERWRGEGAKETDDEGGEQG